MRRRVLARSVLVRACLRLSEPSGRFLSRGLFKAPAINILHPITVLHLPRECEQVRDTGREVACIILKERESSGAEHTKRQQASKATTKSHLGGAICDRLPTVFLSSFNKEASERRKRKGCEGGEEGKGATGRGVKQTTPITFNLPKRNWSAAPRAPLLSMLDRSVCRCGHSSWSTEC